MATLTMGNVLGLSAFGNASSAPGKTGLIATSGSGGLTLPESVNTADGAEPWLLSDVRFHADFRFNDGPAIHYRVKSESLAAVTRGTFTLMAALAGPPDIDVGRGIPIGVEQRRAVYHMLDADWPVPVRNEGLELFVRTTLVTPIHLETLTGEGYATIAADETPYFHLQYATAHGKGGSGWTVGGRAILETDRYTLTVDAFDLVGQVTWPRVEVRRNLLNSRTKTTDAEGYISYAPLIRGVKTIESWSDRPLPHLVATFRPARTTRITELRLTSFGTHFLQVTARLQLTGHTDVIVGLGGLPATATIGLDYKSWRFAVSLGNVNPVHSPTFGISIARRW